tara:strand:- start:139 stop:591 length:453 start_codon:yes stop_codon:yes gene_type:complete
MANFAKIDDNGIVLNVVRMNDEDCLDENGNESEAVGQAHLEKHNNWPADKWIQTSRHMANGVHELGGTPLRANYASIGMKYDAANDIFHSNNKPYPSWVLNTTEGRWISPIGDAPDLPQAQEDENVNGVIKWAYIWNETSGAWDLTDISL